MIQPRLESAERSSKFELVGFRNAAVAHQIIPARTGIGQRKIERSGDRHKKVFVGGVQPLAADVENNAVRQRDRAGTAADAVPGFEDEDG